MADNNSSVNNTESLNDSPNVGVGHYDSYTAGIVDVERSRENYRTSNDERLKKIREAVYKKVSTWPEESKYRIIAEYGDSERLKRSPHGKRLNELCTETLIIHLKKEDLDQILANVVIDERRLANHVKVLEKAKKRQAEQYNDLGSLSGSLPSASSGTIGAFNAGSFQKYASMTAGSPDNKKLLAQIKSGDNTYAIPSLVLRQFSRLRKELSDVLDECFGKLEIAALAASMGITIGNDEDALKKAIINKTILFVALVTGKSKIDNLGNAVADPEPYFGLLKLTSYSYITGEPGLDQSEWKRLRDNARKAKQQIGIVAKRHKARASKHSSAVRALSGGLTSAKDIEKHDNGVLASLSTDELFNLAARYGIDPGKSRSIGKLKLELYRAMAANNRARNKLENESAKYARKGKLAPNSVLDEISIRKDFMVKDKNQTSTVMNGGVPIVNFDRNGVLLDAISKAVPVYLVGSGTVAQSRNGAFSGLRDMDRKKVHSEVEFVKVKELNEKGKLKKTKKRIEHTEEREVFRNERFRDTSSNRRASLSDTDRAALNTILALTDETRHNYIRDYIALKTNSKIIEYVENTKDSIGTDDDYETNLRVALLFAIVNHRTALQKYIEENRFNGKPPFTRQDTLTNFFERVRARGSNIIGKFKFKKVGKFKFKKVEPNLKKRKRGEFRKFKKDVRKNKDTYGEISFSSLPIEDQDFYLQELAAARENPEAYGVKMMHYFSIPNHFEKGTYGAITEKYKNFFMGASYPNILNNARALVKANADKGLPGDERDLALDMLVLLSARLNGMKWIMKYIVAKWKHIFDWREFKQAHSIKRAARLLLGKAKRFTNMSGFGTSNVAGVGVSDVGVSEGQKNGGTQSTTPNGIPLVQISQLDADGKEKRINVVPVYDYSFQNKMEDIFGVLNTANSNLTANPVKGMPGGEASHGKREEKAGVSDVAFTTFTNINSILTDDMKKNLELSAKSTLQKIVVPSVVVNKELSELSDTTAGILKYVKAVSEYTYNTSLNTDALLTMFSIPAVIAGAMPGTIAFPGSNIASAVNTSTQNFNEVQSITDAAANARLTKSIYSEYSNTNNIITARTGARIARLASGGTASITGDAPSSNIFANGARPELVQSSGDMVVTPLHKGGTSTKQTVNRMTLAERSSALATSVASHVIKVSYTLPSGAQDISNQGEAIKVYNVKPGISDNVDLGNGTSASLITLVANIYTQLSSRFTQDQANSQLLSTIAANTASIGTSANNQSTAQGNPFAGGFPTSLDDILSGE